MKKLLTAISILCLPNFICVRVLNLLGHKVHPKSYIGFSIVLVERLYLDAFAKIGHLNIIAVRKILLRKKAQIKSRNRMRGPINILLQREASISNSNSIYRAGSPVSYGMSHLKLGVLGQLVSKHHLDCTRSIEIGDYTTIGGLGTQFWTHGYFHAPEGRERIRIDGEIILGNNVYVGTACIFNPAVKIADGVCIGGGACISKSLNRPGMYVTQSLRYIEKDIDSIRERLDKVEHQVIDEVYEKAIA